MTERTAPGVPSLPRRTLLFAGSAFLVVPFSPPVFAKSQWLITAEEIEVTPSMMTREEAGRNEAFGAPRSEEAGKGAPAVTILTPNEGGRIVSPVDFDVRFVPVPPSQIDPVSIRIIYSGWLDITGRIREFGGRVDAAGIALSKAPLKPDTYRVTIAVADTAGRSARRTVRFTVV